MYLPRTLTLLFTERKSILKQLRYGQSCQRVSHGIFGILAPKVVLVQLYSLYRSSLPFTPSNFNFKWLMYSLSCYIVASHDISGRLAGSQLQSTKNVRNKRTSFPTKIPESEGKEQSVINLIIKVLPLRTNISSSPNEAEASHRIGLSHDIICLLIMPHEALHDLFKLRHE